jgi:leucyl/phenylalanyl-tRNA--protein transferase
MFYGESMFARVPDASKVALAYLVHFLRSSGVELIDCQQETSHLARLGARPMPRTAFLAQMKAATAQPAISEWTPRPLAEGFFGEDSANKALQSGGGSV